MAVQLHYRVGISPYNTYGLSLQSRHQDTVFCGQATTFRPGLTTVVAWPGDPKPLRHSPIRECPANTAATSGSIDRQRRRCANSLPQCPEPRRRGGPPMAGLSQVPITRGVPLGTKYSISRHETLFCLHLCFCSCQASRRLVLRKNSPQTYNIKRPFKVHKAVCLSVHCRQLRD